jgi:hypothetical protein
MYTDLLDYIEKLQNKSINLLFDRTFFTEAVYCRLGFKEFTYDEEFNMFLDRFAAFDFDIYYITLYLSDTDEFEARLARDDKAINKYAHFSKESSVNQQNAYLKMADEIEKAAKVSTNKDFNEYLELQAKALRTADPMLDAQADKKWAELQDTPLELTLTRENYEDELTGTFTENEELKKLLTENGINPIPKDCLGLRVGIINKQGTENLISIKKYLPLLAKNMPFNNEYEQKISEDKESKQTMVDVDLVMLAGDCGKYRAGITIAQNLPNDDKLSLTIGGGRRNVYHRQIRFVNDPSKIQELLDEILNKDQHKYYLREASHWFTIGHENTHSLGPNKPNNKLGKYSHIIEENKADMGALAFLDILNQEGYYTNEHKTQIIVTAITQHFLKTKPSLTQAHRVRTVMQNYYLFKRGAYEIKDGKIFVNIDKVVPAAKEMLSEIIRIQIDDNFEKAEKYVLDNFVWTDEMQIIGEKLQKVDKELNGKLENELADQLLKE